MTDKRNSMKLGKSKISKFISIMKSSNTMSHESGVHTNINQYTWSRLVVIDWYWISYIEIILSNAINGGLSLRHYFVWRCFHFQRTFQVFLPITPPPDTLIFLNGLTKISLTLLNTTTLYFSLSRETLQILLAVPYITTVRPCSHYF